MSTLSQEKDVSKLLSMTDDVVLRNRAYKGVRWSSDARERERQYGRLSKSINDLAETAEKISKAGQP